MTGVVSSFDEQVGLGVVSAPAGEYPFHCTQIADGSRTIRPGQAVEFEVLPGRLGRWEAGRLRP
ncbi:MAG TPA: cold shock domain-containing protein [Acidimicrobiales bacterium]|nr:cold shock domain-containing protein [Acidimicrobiales bacterium]